MAGVLNFSGQLPPLIPQPAPKKLKSQGQQRWIRRILLLLSARRSDLATRMTRRVPRRVAWGGEEGDRAAGWQLQMA